MRAARSPTTQHRLHNFALACTHALRDRYALDAELRAHRQLAQLRRRLQRKQEDAEYDQKLMREYAQMLDRQQWERENEFKSRMDKLEASSREKLIYRSPPSVGFHTANRTHVAIAGRGSRDDAISFGSITRREVLHQGEI